jgi:E1A/CREB-binding protein
MIRNAAQLAARTPGAAAAAAKPVNPEDACTVCNQGRLLFEPPCLYCTQCGQRIKRGQTYHATPPEVELKAFWCHGCFSEHKGDRIPYDGVQDGYLVKSWMVKTKNEQNIEEAWVQCDSCNAWVHQICGLFNRGRNDQNTHYLCPACLIVVGVGDAWGGGGGRGAGKGGGRGGERV